MILPPGKMDDNTAGVLLLCGTCLLPYVLGIVTAVVLRARWQQLGWWGLVPMGGLARALIHSWKISRAE